ncbi:MAG: S-layer homology domain-containing protein [Ruminococcaceae bacterium]|nr:S-layer homology domain-containing protein [Oscillospiraceae bacterium]
MKRVIFIFAVVLAIFITAVSANEPVVFTFNSQEDIDANILTPQNITVVFEDGCAKLTNSTIDPNFYLPLPTEGLDTNVYKYVKIRLKAPDSAGLTLTGQFFVLTDAVTTLGEAGSFVNYEFKPSNDFIDVNVNLDRLNLYKGMLKELRFDPFVGSSEIPNASIYLDFIAIFDTVAARDAFGGGNLAPAPSDKIEESNNKPAPAPIQSASSAYAEGEYVKDPIVFTFNSEDDLANNINKPLAMNAVFENGYAKITNKTSDPNFFLPVESLALDTSVYKYMKIRIKCDEWQGENIMGQIFTATDKNTTLGAPGSFSNFTFASNGDFTTVELDLSLMSAYKGTLTTLRFDPFVGSDDRPNATIYLDYIALFDNEQSMKNYPDPLTDEQLQKIIDQVESTKIKVSRSEKPENLVYKFRSYADFTAFATGTNQMNYEFTEGSIKITNLGTDPFINRSLLREEYFYANDLTVLKVRFKPLVDLGENATRLAQFFFTTDNAQMGEPGTYINIKFPVNAQWQELVIDLKNDINNSKWDGIVTKIRYDTVVAETKDEVIPMLLDYFGLFPDKEAAMAYSPEALLPAEGHDTVTMSYGMQNIILPADTVKAGDTISDFALISETAENPDKIIGGAVVNYTSPDGKEELVALSYNDTGVSTYVARRPGKYSLTYNTKNYVDIAGHWGYPTIMFASNRKLFGGTSPTEFSPDLTMTRGMFITVLGRMHGIDTALYSNITGYTDVSESEYYAPYISWAKEMSLMDGATDSAFAPEEPITRSDMALVISNYVDKYGYEFKSSENVDEFNDISALSDNVKKAIKEVQAVGIINGKGEGRFDPNGVSTRAEVATVMSRLIKSILGLELNFFETSEESMEFKKLDPNRLIIGAYVPHPASMNTLSEQEVKYIADAEIDFAILGYDNFNAIPVEKQKNAFKWYERYGIEFVNSDINGAMKYAADGRTAIYDSEKAINVFYKDETSFAGFSLADEPGYIPFEEMGKSVAQMAQDYPDKTAFINLLPMYANEKQLMSGAWADTIAYYDDEPATYQKYLDEYVKHVPTHYICADVYPCYSNKKTYEDYARSLEIIADTCRASGRDFWIVNQSCSWSGGIRIIDLDDMYWQTYTVLSFGAKAIMYYMFANRGNHIGTPLDANGNRTDTYYILQKVHQELRRFEDIYLSYDNIGAFNHNSSPEKTPWLELANPCKFDTITEIKCDSPLLFGCFDAKDKTSKAFTVVNYNDLAKPAAADVSLKISGNIVTAYFDGNPTILTPDADGYYNIHLESGRGVFVTVR